MPSQKYIDKIADPTPELRVALDDLAAQWSPSPLPSTIAAACLADTLVSNISRIPVNAVKVIFGLCEEALQQGSADDKADIATGFLEALQNADSSGHFDFTTIVAFLGSASKEHCRGMDRFYGVTTSGL
ncbi:hypothetical protein [Mesorhizobium sp.]|uniref:DUF7674 family protein n=1 Tax=Mesorhizobium sp. TaxID=1871066 RepID=UPI000FE91441|nr:hypothetical protein [Mesorhizobium sp.]RWE65841.1 MAG: hypothetical protein EOS62_22955 [Mesorhizobium sp.]RWF00969.1 MAG: hypothetical protein EOS43_11255 [Mesorhizobium sp.]